MENGKCQIRWECCFSGTLTEWRLLSVGKLGRAFESPLKSFTGGPQFPGILGAESESYLSPATARLFTSVLGLHPTPPPNVLTEHYVQSLCYTPPTPIMHGCCFYKASCFSLLTLQQLPLTNVLKITSSVRCMETLGTWGRVGIFRAASEASRKWKQEHSAGLQLFGSGFRAIPTIWYIRHFLKPHVF